MTRCLLVNGYCTRKIATGGHQSITGTDATSALNNWDFSNREAFIFSAALLGDGFAVLHRNERGGIADIETVMKWRVALEYLSDKLFYRIAADENMNQPHERLIPAENCLHLKWRVTGKHSALGESPLVRLLPALDAVLRVREGQRRVLGTQYLIIYHTVIKCRVPRTPSQNSKYRVPRTPPPL